MSAAAIVPGDAVPAPVCSAVVQFALGPRTDVTAGCGLTEDQHLNKHVASEVVFSSSKPVCSVIARFMWDGEFKP